MNIQLAFWQRYKERQCLEGAVDRAYERFARQHPGHVTALFDRHFLDHAAVEALRDPLDVQALDLAQAWAEQIGTSPEARRRAERWAMPAARAFVGLFRAELNASFARLPLHIRPV